MVEFFFDAAGESSSGAGSAKVAGAIPRRRDPVESWGGRPSALAIRRVMQRQPIATSASLVAATGLTPATVNKSLAHLERIGVAAELTQRPRGRVFSYKRYIAILNEGMGLP